MTPTETPLISVDSVGVSYKISRKLFASATYSALRDVSFKVYPGDSLGVLGRNGAGKTTLLRLLTGIISPDTGSIENNSCSTALLSLQAGFDGELDGRTNAILNAMLLGFSRTEVLNRLDSIIEFSELGDFINKPVKVYSTGMRARLGFSIALHMDPDVLLVDEVLGVGDADFREKSTAVMKKRLQSEQTIILVSHQPNVVKALCNRAVWIEQGVTRMEGEAKTVVNAYEEYMTSNQNQPNAR